MKSCRVAGGNLTRRLPGRNKWPLTPPDRTTIMRLRQVANQGALNALSSSRPWVRPGAPDPELVEARAEIARLSDALKEMGVRLMLAEGKGAGTEWPGE
jgi:transposase